MKKKAKRFQEGGFSKEQEEWLGGADRTDPYILARMRAAVPDKEPEKIAETIKDVEEIADTKSPKSVEKTVVKTKVSPATFKPLTTKDEEGNKLPTDVKKPYIAIPKTAAGMQQYRSDAISPAERLWKSLTETRSDRAKAKAGMKSGGSVKVSSASKRADGIAKRGKTRGKIC